MNLWKTLKWVLGGAYFYFSLIFFLFEEIMSIISLYIGGHLYHFSDTEIPPGKLYFIPSSLGRIEIHGVLEKAKLRYWRGVIGTQINRNLTRTSPP